VKMQEGEWRLERGDFRAQWNPRQGKGCIHQAPSPFAIDSVLRIVHTLILAEEGGFLLHSASAVRNGRAFLFAGISGTGKTTLSRLAPPDVMLLTDEVSYVRQVAQGYRAFGTPFAGELARPGENVSAPVAALYLLQQASENRVAPLAAPDAVRGLMQNILFFARDQELVGRLFQTACAFVAKVPVYRLGFLPDERVWELIR